MKPKSPLENLLNAAKEAIVILETPPNQCYARVRRKAAEDLRREVSNYIDVEDSYR